MIDVKFLMYLFFCLHIIYIFLYLLYVMFGRDLLNEGRCFFSEIPLRMSRISGILNDTDKK